MQVSVSHNLDGLMDRLNWHRQRLIAEAGAEALTKTAFDVRDEEYRVMESVFDRPTRFTLNSLFVQGAKPNKLEAKVHFKDVGGTPAWRYLTPQIMGGPRRHKRFEEALIAAGIMRENEFAVPGHGAKLDRHGNMPGNEIVRILSQLGAAETSAGFQANITARSRRGAVKRAGGRYIVLRPETGDPRSKVYGRAPAGIYLRKGGRYPLVPVIRFVRAPVYRKRLPYFETARKVIAARLPAQMQKAMAKRAGAAPRPGAPRAA